MRYYWYKFLALTNLFILPVVLTVLYKAENDADVGIDRGERQSHFAPLIVNEVSYVMRINHVSLSA